MYGFQLYLPTLVNQQVFRGRLQTGRHLGGILSREHVLLYTNHLHLTTNGWVELRWVLVSWVGWIKLVGFSWVDWCDLGKQVCLWRAVRGVALETIHDSPTSVTAEHEISVVFFPSFFRIDTFQLETLQGINTTGHLSRLPHPIRLAAIDGINKIRVIHSIRGLRFHRSQKIGFLFRFKKKEDGEKKAPCGRPTKEGSYMSI